MPRMSAAPRLQEAPAPRAIDHVILRVSDYRRAKPFYERTLRPLGLGVRLDWPDRGRAFFGLPGELSSVWLLEGAGRCELTLAAPDRAAVDAFYAAALAGGATPLRAPAPQPDYTSRAYAASVADGDGNVLEAVCR